MTEQSRTYYRITLFTIAAILILTIPLLAGWLNDLLTMWLGE